MNSNPIAKLSIEHVGKRFKGSSGIVTALNDVCLDVEPGEFMILVGPSGCGKSTLLNVVGGLEKADEGQVFMDGRRVLSPGPERAMVFQDGALFPWLTAVQNVEFGLRQMGLPAKERRERALHYLQIVNLTKFAKSCIHELSGGMRQRVAIARALAVEPRIMLMDEPFSALDAQTREDLYVELQKILEQIGATILFVTHNVREAATLGDRVVVLRRPNAQDEKDLGILPSVQAEFPIDIMRPRHIDDEDVARTAKRISMAMRHGHTHINPEEYDDEEQFDALGLLRGFDHPVD